MAAKMLLGAEKEKRNEISARYGFFGGWSQ